MTTNLFFFDLYRPYLNIERSDSSILPREYNQIYSKELGNMFKGSQWDNPILDGSETRQLITFPISKGYKVIVKRKAIFCDITKENPEEEDNQIFSNSEFQNFLNDGLKEYFISRLLSAHPAGVNCYDFRVTKLPEKKYLLYEFMMEYVGENLQEHFLQNNKVAGKIKGLDLFIEMVNIFKFIEKLRLAYNDVKMGNFLVDSNGHLRITDYDTVQQEGFLLTLPFSGVTHMIGFTPGYVSPEALDFIKRQENEQSKPKEKIDPWKADVYSCGIVGLILLNALKTPKDIINLEIFKDNENDHKTISDFAKLVESENEKLREKIQFIIEVCIEYYPNQRPSFKQLSILLENIKDEKVTLQMIKTKYHKMKIEEKLIAEFKEIITKKLNEQNHILSNFPNIEPYINEIINLLKIKIKEENEKYEKEKEKEKEKAEFLEKCKEPSKEFNKELPKELNDIPMIIKNPLNFNIPKYKNYEDAFNQIVNGGKISKKIAEIIKSTDHWWHIEEKDKESTKEDIINVLELVKYSEKIKKLTFTENRNFDAECERAYLDAIKANNSLKTILLYLTNVSKEVTLEMLKMLEIKPAIKVLIVEKTKIKKKDAQKLAKKIKLEINNWKSKYWNDDYASLNYC